MHAGRPGQSLCRGKLPGVSGQGAPGARDGNSRRAESARRRTLCSRAVVVRAASAAACCCASTCMPVGAAAAAASCCCCCSAVPLRLASLAASTCPKPSTFPGLAASSCCRRDCRPTGMRNRHVRSAHAQCTTQENSALMPLLPVHVPKVANRTLDSAGRHAHASTKQEAALYFGRERKPSRGSPWCC